MADWANLPRDLVFEIGKRVTFIESYESFASVCKSWRKVATKDSKHVKHKTFESSWLMLAEKEPGMREFLHISTGKIRKFYLPDPKAKYCLSWEDWLLIVGEDEVHASLFHLVSRIQIHLPMLNTTPVHKFVLSSTSDLIVMVIWGASFQLGFCNPGDTSWTTNDNWNIGFSDIKYYDDKLYALDRVMRTVKCDVNGSNPTRLQQVFYPPNLFENNYYMVEFTNKILIIRRFVDCETEPLKIYEVNKEDGTVKIKVVWNNHISLGSKSLYLIECLEIKDLENKTLFLGYNSSFLIESSIIDGYKPNCIYFSTDNTKIFFGICENSMSVFKLKNRTVTWLYDEEEVCSEITPPTWIGPRIY